MPGRQHYQNHHDIGSNLSYTQSVQYLDFRTRRQFIERDGSGRRFLITRVGDDALVQMAAQVDLLSELRSN